MCDRSYSFCRFYTVLAVLIAGLLLVTQSSAFAQTATAVVAVKSGVNATTVFAQYGLTLLDSVPELNEYLVSGDSGNLQTLSKDPNVVSFEYDIPAEISETAMLNESTVALLDPDTVALLDGQGSLWNSQQPDQSTILTQPALEEIHLNPANVDSVNPITVAVIDTGVDPFHEMLIGATLPGENFINQSLSTDELLDLDPATAALLLQTTGRAGLDEEVVAFINPATVALLEPQLIARLGATPYFGHGTLVSGLIHSIAPTASILPLKAFDPSGIGTSFRIAKAIVYAVAQGARVINMSFNLDSYSALVGQAVQYASSQNIVLVASIGNLNSNVNQSYPASYPKVIGVAATDLSAKKASFSNYGPPAAIAAPGEALISSYPGSLYAAWSGTSAAAALVSGEAALLLSRESFTADQAANRIESTADHLNDPPYQLGQGQIDLQSLLASVPAPTSSSGPSPSAPSPNSICNGVYTGAFNGTVTVSAGQSCTFQNADITGNVVVTGGTLTLSGGMVVGNVQINGGTFFIGPSTTIKGNLQVQNTSPGTGLPSSTSGVNQVCGSLVYNDLQYQNNAASVQIGSASPSTCAGNAIGGNLQVGGNAGSTSIFGNAVTGDLQDQNNTGSSQVFGNTVTGNLQCQSNSSITGGQNTAKQTQGQCASFPPPQ